MIEYSKINCGSQPKQNSPITSGPGLCHSATYHVFPVLFVPHYDVSVLY